MVTMMMMVKVSRRQSYCYQDGGAGDFGGGERLLSWSGEQYPKAGGRRRTDRRHSFTNRQWWIWLVEFCLLLARYLCRTIVL